MAWNFADVYEVVAAAIPDAPSLIHGDRIVSWRDLDRRANALAAGLVESGLGEQAKVAVYTYNGPEYLESYVAAFKAGLAPVNVNYRYGPDELTYLLDNADAEAVVFHATFGPVLDQIRGRLPRVRQWFVVADGQPAPDWATAYEDVVGGGADRTVAPWGRSDDHLLMLYTGGTTGMPKGVMWRQGDLWEVLGGGGNAFLGIPPVATLDEIAARVTGGTVMLPACPLMHGTGQFSSLVTLNVGGAVCTLTSRRFDAAELWQTVQDRRVLVCVIVGDAFARPMLAALADAAAAGRSWDLSSLVSIVSSGVMWSHEVKEALSAHLGRTLLIDSLGSSEAVGLGSSISTAGQAEETARFALGERVHVFSDDGRPIEPGSGDVGFVAISGPLPVGYYNDDEKTARTFRVIDGVRYSIPGDFATVGADGSLHLLGRGSVCINTGGEKVFPEEVEEVLKQHAAIVDAVCVGIPDDRFGEAICAIVQPRATDEPPDAADVIAFVKTRLASYKAPRHMVVVDTIGRSPAGKVDYGGLKRLVVERLGLTPAAP